VNKSILIIDDEKSILTSLKGALNDENYQVFTANSGQNGLEILKQNQVDIVLLDIWMPRLDGISVLKLIKQNHPEQIVIMMSGHGTIETAVKATKTGAYDFIEKPFSLEKLYVCIQNALNTSNLSKENQALRKQIKRQSLLIGKSQSIEAIKERIKQVAPTTGSILITGENGTGKELIAHSIHALSQRFNKPFIEVNCAAIPEELIESELFGHEKGAFTGATQQRRGKFDLADGGTLFLDEIGDMSLKTQSKVLRILQEQTFERVGGHEVIHVDVRIIAATNKNLKNEIQNQRFREDLYYRLNVVPMVISPLRERIPDIPVLVDYFMNHFSNQLEKPKRTFSNEAIQVLEHYPWPGNVRELRNLIERMMILSKEDEKNMQISATHILSHLSEENFTYTQSSSDKLESNNLKEARSLFEKDFILKALNSNNGNISKTASTLGIERSYLHKKIKLFEIDI